MLPEDKRTYSFVRKLRKQLREEKEYIKEPFYIPVIGIPIPFTGEKNPKYEKAKKRLRKFYYHENPYIIRAAGRSLGYSEFRIDYGI